MQELLRAISLNDWARFVVLHDNLEHKVNTLHPLGWGQDPRGWSPLLLSAWFGRTQMVRRLVKHGAKVNMPNNNGYSALHMAVQGDHPATARVLVAQLHANVNQENKDGVTPIFLASQLARISTIRVLVELHCDINKRSKTGKTPSLFS